MPSQQLPWADLIADIASEEREIESSVGNFSPYEPMNPYWDESEIEQFLLEISQRKLREIASEALQMCGSLAVQTVSGAPPVLPPGTIGIFGALIQVTAGDTYWRPAQRVNAAQWYQTANAPASNFTRYALLDGGRIAFVGNALTVVAVVEPTLAHWQNDDPILPPAGFDQERKQWVHEKLMVQDFMPEGRV